MLEVSRKGLTKRLAALFRLPGTNWETFFKSTTAQVTITALTRFGTGLTPWRISKFILGACSIALALGWGKYVATGYVYLPAFPDYIDVLLGVVIGLFLFADYFKDILKKKQ